MPDLLLSRVNNRQQDKLSEIADFLDGFDLLIDKDVEFFVVAYSRDTTYAGESAGSKDKIVACGGIAGNILKSIAISPELHGTGFSLTLMTELTSLAYEMGRYHLFLFTKPQNVKLFRQSGFFPVEQADDKLVLLENSQCSLKNYCRKLNQKKVSGNKIGSIVMNANPFTLGHQYLIEQAAGDCDWLHLFVVKEDCEFSYSDRLEMIKQGTAHIPNITIHPGSNYIISKATFPTYFIKSQGLIDFCYTAIDLQIFRKYIAPALGITHRYVGTEPECVVTRHYNQQMKHWLFCTEISAPQIDVVEILRRSVNDQPISASTVRKLLDKGDNDGLASFLPRTSIDYIRENLPQKIHRRGAIVAA
ncbi:[Citrate [pro-3S]-lyase] ligase [Vibrio aerogenes CECT 7868]|uniref:[Citrate [pro-3S]-lyase] ligase n=1 Tax=Vibrio aerogenes CECT 7868 TaxID=1216006 RepID=A0A1M5ZPL1_9VIBR|nr:[citrate (pro-3S)-lyase] ligase [Vibrio aerogenes]SHI25863.1 [Citrate [pro-3S]-lyase] ligase [Vibrio aerogenes CECT 7868]